MAGAIPDGIPGRQRFLVFYRRRAVDRRDLGPLCPAGNPGGNWHLPAGNWVSVCPALRRPLPDCRLSGRQCSAGDYRPLPGGDGRGTGPCLQRGIPRPAVFRPPRAGRPAGGPPPTGISSGIFWRDGFNTRQEPPRLCSRGGSFAVRRVGGPAGRGEDQRTYCAHSKIWVSSSGASSSVAWSVSWMRAAPPAAWTAPCWAAVQRTRAQLLR